MKSKARIQFVGDDTYVKEASGKLLGFLKQTGLYEAVQLCLDEQDYVDIFFGRFDLKSQLHWLAVFLLDWHSWHFVGEECPNVGKGVKHLKERRNMHLVPHPMRGDNWVCQEVRCRNHLAPSSDDYMSMSNFRMMAQILQNDPSPIRKVLPTPSVWQREFPRSWPGDRDALTGERSEKYVKTMEHDTLLQRIRGISEDKAKVLVDKLFEAFPALKEYRDLGSARHIAMLTLEKDRLETDLKDEKEAHDNTQAARDFLQSELNKVKATPQDHPGLVIAADDMLRFLAGLNMQDHTIADQREFRDKFTLLKNALKGAKKD